MAKCTKPNYSTDKFSGDLTLQDVTPDLSVEAVSDIVMNTLYNQNNFSVSIDSSEDQINYSDSIDELIEDIDKLLPKEIDRDKLAQILKSKLLPNQLTDIEKLITISIPNSNLISEQERTSISYNEILHNIYGNSNFGIDRWREMKFIDEIQQRTIVDTKNRVIVDSNSALANNLINYQESMFQTIKKYLKDGLFSSYPFPQTMYRANPKTKVKERVSTYTSVMQAMYNIIESKREQGTLENDIIDGWGQSISNKPAPFYDAMIAYINLEYFDTVLEQLAGDFIEINKEMSSPIEVEVNDDGIPITQYKYKRSIGNTNLGKNWGVEFEDSVNKLSKFSRELINSIPIYSYETKQLEFGKLQPKDFIGTVVKLKDVGSRVTDKEFADAVVSLIDSKSLNNGPIQIVFNKIFKDQNNSDLINELNNLGFNLADLNILYSIYRTVFDPSSKQSWLNIENNYTVTHGIKSRYNLVDSLYGVIVSNSSMNYLQSTYDSYTNQYVTKTKDKFSINIPKFEIIQNANNEIVNRETNYDGLYEITSAYNSWNLKIGNNTYSIRVAKDGTFTLLMKDYKRFNIPTLVHVPDISNYSKRMKLINRDNLTEDESKFMDIINFIDTMLITNFGSSERDLNSFYLSCRSNRTFFKQIFLSAARSLYIQNIYRDFRNATKQDGTQYSIIELPQYLESLNLGLPKYGNPTYRDYFNTQYNGEHLKVIGVNEEWTNILAKIRTILQGDSSRSTISDLLGSKRPNSSPSFLGEDVKLQMKKSSQSNEAAAYLLFSKYPNAILGSAIDTDIQLQNGVKKLVKDFTEGELLTNSIIYKFWYPISERVVYIQPTTYSDKTKFVRYGINLNNIQYNGNTLYQIIFNPNMNSIIENMLIDTVGSTYSSSLDSIRQDYSKLLGKDMSLKDINDFLKGTTEEKLLKMVDTYNRTHQDRLEFGPDLHYRITGNGLALNELLYEFATNLYTKSNLHSRILQEKVNFIKDLVTKKVSIDFSDQLKLICKKLPSKYTDNVSTVTDDSSDFEKNWVKNGKLILAKGTLNGEDIDIIYTMPDGVKNIKLNPLLDAYFMVDNLLGNNLRYGITGSEINHPLKALRKLNLNKLLVGIDSKYIRLLKPDYNGEGLTFFDFDQMIKYYDSNKDFKQLDPQDGAKLKQLVDRLRSVYTSKLYEYENAGQAAQFKRNVAIPATMFKMIPKLNGIGKTMNIACMEDVKADVFNFDGKVDQVDSCDGSAQVVSFWSILENRSLNDSEVGWVKKPLHHAYDYKTMTATLLKYATDTITNQWMRQSEGNVNGIRLKDIFKKMTNIPWGDIDLLRCDFKESGGIDFNQDILEKVPLFYNSGDEHYQINDFGIEDGVYYTVETLVDTFGGHLGDSKKVYHYFDYMSNHIKSDKLLNDFNYHTIGTLYELHTALGGIYSESLGKKGKELKYSEASNFAVANFIVHVATLNPGANPNDLSIDSYNQPLKNAMIHMIANHTAIKEGYRNMNPSTSWYDNSRLNYMTVSTDNYGIQQDSDHEADQAYMTEFSQVINSLDAGGYLHNYVSEIYKQLGQTALDLSQVELDSIDEFRSTGDKNKVYDLVARTIFANLRSGRNNAGLAEAIMNSIKRDFNLNTNHSLDKLKVPFSDVNIYSNILSTFVSNINKKSIKRQYPGLGMVMVPSYDMSMVYDYNGSTYQYEDLIKIAYAKGYKSNISDTSLKNRDVVSQLLNSEQELQPFTNVESFMPTDNVVCYFSAEKFNINSLDLSQVEYELIKQPYKDSDGSDQFRNILKIYIKGNKNLGSFNLIKDKEFGHFSVYFDTGNPDTGEIYGTTPEQRNILYENLYNAIPEGAYVTTYGNASKGGLYALNKLMEEYVGDYKVENQKGTTKSLDTSNKQIEIPIYQKFGTGEYEYKDQTLHQEHISLNSVQDYYEFTENPEEYLRKLGYSNIQNLQFKKDVSRPRNLAPAKIYWKYKDKNNEEHQMSIFRHPTINKFIHEVWKVTNDKSLSRQEKKNKISQLRHQYNPQQVFSNLKKGFFIDDNGDKYQIYDLSNTEAECIMSNIYKSTFGIKDGDSLMDVINTGAKYFSKSSRLIVSDNFDLAFTKRSGKHLYITFNGLAGSSDEFSHYKQKWSNVVRKDNDGTASVNKVYAMNRDNTILFEIGREIIREDIKWDSIRNAFTQNGNVVQNQSKYRRDGDRVLEYVEFLTKHRVIETKDNKTIKYTLYNIDREAIKKVLDKGSYPNGITRVDKKTGKTYTITEDQKFEEDVNNFISSLLADIYKTDSFGGIQINKKLTTNSGEILNSTLHNFGVKLNYNQYLSSYVLKIQELLSKTKPVGGYKLSTKQLNVLLKEYNQNLSNSIYNSFLRSQYFTSSRIPAQTLQSFMLMKNVGFTGVDKGQCFVSVWQTWLQGSDYDIDKSYMLGLSFDNNGMYIGWSPLFDYSSIEGLKASEYLPAPQKTVYNKVTTGYSLQDYINLLKKYTGLLKDAKEQHNANPNDIVISNNIEKYQNILDTSGLDLNPYILNILQAPDSVTMVNKYVEILKAINIIAINKKANIYYSIPDGKEVVQRLMQHEFVELPTQVTADANKNFIASHIQNVIQDLENMIAAYQPVEMEDLRDASALSPKSKQQSQMVLLNPSTKLLMQYANITGKNVVGVAANGIKASFMWYYYINDILHNPLILDFDKKLDYAKFNFKTSRLIGRSTGDYQEITINTLSDINLNGVDEDIIDKLGTKLDSTIPVDNSGSQLVSAATDNAKELILAKINSGTKLAKMYSFLISLGVDLNDIVSFMTSDVASFIDSATETDIFNDYNVSVDEALNIAKSGKIPNKLLKHKDKILSLYNQYNLNSENRQQIIEDINEFRNILEASNEFSNFARLLGLNQGIPTTKVDLENTLSFIQSIFNKRLEEYLESNPTDDYAKNIEQFDVYEWLHNSDYREQIAYEYNHIKKCINVFDIFDSIPQFDAIRQILSAVIDIDNVISIKSKAYNKVYTTAKSMGIYMPEDYQKRLLSGIDDVLISNFVLSKKLNIPIKEGTIYLTPMFSTTKARVTSSFNIRSKEDLASFKYIFEHSIVPMLREGKTLVYDSNNDIKEVVDPRIRNNAFIKGLRLVKRNDKYFYTVDLNMLTIENSTESQQKFQRYSLGLQNLSTIDFGNTRLSDLFVLYNLIVNKGAYGADKLTTLFDTFLKSGTDIGLLNEYYSYLGKRDYLYDVKLDIEQEFDETNKNNNTKDKTITIDFEDILMSAAPIVTSTVGRKDPYVIINRGDGLKLMKRSGGSYEEVEPLLDKVKGEDVNSYLSRVNNFTTYYTLGKTISGKLNKQINDIITLKDNTVDILQDFVTKGILLIQKICK